MAAVALRGGVIRFAQNNGDATFRAHIAFAVVSVGPAQTFGRKHAGLRKTDERQRVGKNTDTAHNGSINISGLQGTNGQIKSHHA